MRFLPLVLALAAASAIAAPPPATGLKTELETLARERVFFGHQSVGSNMLDGLRELAGTAGVPLRIVEIRGDAVLPAATFGHAFVDENGNPHRKLRSFEQALQALGPAQAPDVALLKFCYADITADTDVKALFVSYRETMERLKKRYPRTTFVHATVPLTDVQTGGKALAKRLLGRAPWGTVENVQRAEYNTLLRAAFAGREPVFDLAQVESTAPDGRVATVAWGGKVVPAMARDYTDDGGHLNTVGRVQAARALVSALARAR